MPFTIVESDLEILSSDVSYGFTDGGEFINDVTVAENRQEQRLVYSDEPFFRYDLGYLIKTEEEAEDLREFFYAHGGREQAFRMKDWSLYKSCKLYNEPSFDDVVLGTAAPGQTQFQLKKVWAVGNRSKSIDVIKPNGATVRIGEDDAEVFDDYTINEETGILTRATPCSGGEVITAGFEFFQKCRFDMDHFPFTAEGFKVGSFRIPVVSIPLQNGL